MGHSIFAASNVYSISSYESLLCHLLTAALAEIFFLNCIIFCNTNILSIEETSLHQSDFAKAKSKIRGLILQGVKTMPLLMTSVEVRGK